MTAERVGQVKGGAWRACIVTPKFRAVMQELKVKGVSYVPVRMV
jgi:hypothetical protein